MISPPLPTTESGELLAGGARPIPLQCRKLFGRAVLIEQHNRLRARVRNRRKNAAFVRQGEWFILPAPGFVADERLVLRLEPLRRGRGKSHWDEFVYRAGGESVHVCPRRPNGVTEAEYRRILGGNPGAKAWGWRTMRRNPGVYVQGRVRHPDHATTTLRGWHRVVMNTESHARAMRSVAFLD